ncbi:hypothetical protein VOLCADRAFT_107926 [Volvox carteri f. nagariensis]|uniref:Uncharacterized protein n=1 Tax=Volvox carteri f. nagariensis TaxID=3068 RepID=D8UH88_VOLCA|nr:uncharacterized protein VOLCADRAFT_107926 [Volvox carteri f. nagariensis]EFJ40862.1 hypothetical protein VOLCADRAFT_107926 [Volvox carteri f. nagariensis]|eukprot:XP_002958022.1 hypothetical protein VOLCADRAFT_107926 [Volvox carteri f. nagariensis]
MRFCGSVIAFYANLSKPKHIRFIAALYASAALASRHGSSPYSFRATAERVGSAPDGRATYRYSGPSATGSLSGTGKPLCNTLGSSGLPPVAYKSYLTEYVDEYREPVAHLDTLKTLTQKFNTTGGTNVTKRSTRSDGLPKYESRVIAF